MLASFVLLRPHAHTPKRSHADTFSPASRSPHKFATAIRADGIHLLSAIWAKRTFKTTNVGFSLSRKVGRTFFTGRFHFQRHGMEGRAGLVPLFLHEPIHGQDKLDRSIVEKLHSFSQIEKLSAT